MKYRHMYLYMHIVIHSQVHKRQPVHISKEMGKSFIKNCLKVGISGGGKIPEDFISQV